MQGFPRNVGHEGGTAGWQDQPGGASGNRARLLLRHGALAHPGGQEAEIDEITVESVATLDADLLRITTVDLEIRGSVSGLPQRQFRDAAEAEKVCPVSNALRNNVDVRLRAVLEN